MFDKIKQDKDITSDNDGVSMINNTLLGDENHTSTNYKDNNLKSFDPNFLYGNYEDKERTSTDTIISSNKQDNKVTVEEFHKYYNENVRSKVKNMRAYFAKYIAEKEAKQAKEESLQGKETSLEKHKRKYNKDLNKKSTRSKGSDKMLPDFSSVADSYRNIDPKSVYFTKEKWAKVNPQNKLILEEWAMDMRARKVTLNTIGQYEGDAKLIFIYMLLYQNNKCVTEMSLRDWKIYTLFLIDSKVSNARVNRMLSTVRNMLAFAEESELFPEYTHSTATRLHGIPKTKTREIVFIEDEDFMTFYKYLMKEKRYMEATLWALAYESAGRKIELSQVEKAYVTNDRNCTNVVTGKRGKKFSLIYFDLTKKAAKEYLASRKDDNPMLFVNREGKTLAPEKLYQTFVGMREDFAFITGKQLEFNVHSLRHSALENYSTGTHEVCRKRKLEGIPIEKLKLISHHSSTDVCTSYLKDKSNSELEGLFDIKLD